MTMTYECNLVKMHAREAMHNKFLSLASVARHPRHSESNIALVSATIALDPSHSDLVICSRCILAIKFSSRTFYHVFRHALSYMLRRMLGDLSHAIIATYPTPLVLMV